MILFNILMNYLKSMKKIHLLYILLISFCSCTSLKEDPKSFITPEQFYKTQADAVAAVNAAYYQLNAPAQTPYNVLFSTGMDMMSDDIDPGPGATNADVRSQSILAHASTGLRIIEIWQQHYAAIKRANVGLEKIPGIDFNTTLKNRLVGELKFLRALWYFNLVRLYGDVPLILQDQTSDDPAVIHVARTPAETVYSQIIQDLTEASDVLPNSYSGIDVGRATKGAALSLLGKVYLTKYDWGNAVKFSENVTGPAPDFKSPFNYDLFANYSQVFLPANKNGIEHVFSAQFKSNAQGQGNNQAHRGAPQGTGPLWASTITKQIPGLLGNYAEQLHFYTVGHTTHFSVYDLYSPKDKRRDATFITSYKGTDGVDYPLIAPHLHKYFDPSTPRNLQESGANVPIIRYAEVLLNLSEAENELNGPTAKAYAALNKVRKRAGLDELTQGLTQDQFRDSVYLDRRLELVWEYQRWFDLIRQRDADGKRVLVKRLHEAGKTNAPEKHYLFPIPQQEIDINPKLTQNPGW